MSRTQLSCLWRIEKSFLSYINGGSSCRGWSPRRVAVFMSQENNEGKTHAAGRMEQEGRKQFGQQCKFWMLSLAILHMFQGISFTVTSYRGIRLVILRYALFAYGTTY